MHVLHPAPQIVPIAEILALVLELVVLSLLDEAVQQEHLLQPSTVVLELKCRSQTGHSP
jgi:hypothetical protein